MKVNGVTVNRRSIIELRDDLRAVEAAIRILEVEREKLMKMYNDAAFLAYQFEKAPNGKLREPC